MTSNAYVASGGQLLGLSTMFSVKAGTGSPAYLVLTGLDRNEYTVTATGATGALIGNGISDGFHSIGGDGRGVGMVFTLQTASGRYYNSTYGYFDQVKYQVSGSSNDVTNLSLFSTNNLNLASSYADNAYAMEQLDASGYLGSATIATQPAYTTPVPSQATPDSIAAVAQSFVDKAWNTNGCWVLASTIAAEAGTSLPVDSSMVGVSGQSNGEWFVAFDGSKQSGNWQSLVKAGEIVVIGSASSGHITTCVAGAGSTAMLIDNITYVNSSGAVQNLANDGSSHDIKIAAAHLASQEWAGVQTSLVKIYELDTPIITELVTLDKLALNSKQALNQLFSAADPMGKAIAAYQVYNAASADTLVVNGVSVSAHNATAAVTVSSLSAVSLQSGASVTSDTVTVRAYNGSYWGDWESLSVSVGGASSTQAKVAPPVVTQTSAQTWTQGAHVSFTLPLNTFTDPNGQKLSYSAMLADGHALPSWLKFQATTATFSGDVPLGMANLSLKVTATDTSGLSASETIAVTVPAAAPTLLHQTTTQHWSAGQHVALTLPANTFSDPQGQHLSYTAFELAGPDVRGWLSFNAATDTFSGIVPKTASGTIALEVIATDTSGLHTADIFSVTLGSTTTPAVLVGVPDTTHGLSLIH